jgi:hypothetical protein
MPSNFGDNSTVVGDAAYKQFNGKESPPPAKAQISTQGFTGKTRMSEFTTVDYTVEERPFFIPIGKDGVIAALEKLDRQLQEVFKVILVYELF